MCRAVKHFDQISMIKKYQENQINSRQEEQKKNILIDLEQIDDNN